MATQLQQFLLLSSPLLAVWLLIWMKALSFFEDYRTELLVGGPLAVIGILGVYAAGSVVIGVLSFNDCPEAREELVKQIVEAKEDLRRRRVIE